MWPEYNLLISPISQSNYVLASFYKHLYIFWTWTSIKKKSRTFECNKYYKTPILIYTTLNYYGIHTTHSLKNYILDNLDLDNFRSLIQHGYWHTTDKTILNFRAPTKYLCIVQFILLSCISTWYFISLHYAQIRLINLSSLSLIK